MPGRGAGRETCGVPLEAERRTLEGPVSEVGAGALREVRDVREPLWSAGDVSFGNGTRRLVPMVGMSMLPSPELSRPLSVAMSLGAARRNWLGPGSLDEAPVGKSERDERPALSVRTEGTGPVQVVGEPRESLDGRLTGGAE